MEICEFFGRLLLTGLFGMLVSGGVICWIIYPVDLKERIYYIVAKILLVIACTMAGIGVCGMIWTF
jgi:hypothetical protein